MTMVKSSHYWTVQNSFFIFGKNSYFEYKLPYADLTSEWNISLVDKNSEYTEEEKSYYEGLIKLTVMNNVTISLKPGKAHSLIGKRFNLSATDNKETIILLLKWRCN